MPATHIYIHSVEGIIQIIQYCYAVNFFKHIVVLLNISDFVQMKIIIIIVLRLLIFISSFQRKEKEAFNLFTYAY